MNNEIYEKVLEITLKSLSVLKDKLFLETRLKNDLGLTLGEICILLMDIDKEFDFVLYYLQYNLEDINDIADVINLFKEACECRENTLSPVPMMRRDFDQTI